MFSSKELIKFNFDTRWFYYVITKTDKFVDISIFTKEEWERLNEINKKFKKEQLVLESLSDEYHKSMFNINNSNYEKKL